MDLINTLKVAFDLEIMNETYIEKNKLIVSFPNRKKAFVYIKGENNEK